MIVNIWTVSSAMVANDDLLNDCPNVHHTLSRVYSEDLIALSLFICQDEGDEMDVSMLRLTQQSWSV